MPAFSYKDNFSEHSSLYALFRPVYPHALYEWLLPQVHQKKNAWDCGTGNGQVAIVLADYFESVFATDISQNQLDQAKKHERIFYKLESSDKSSFPDNFFDLITVAQAIHWFDFEGFYREVNRTLKPEGILVVMGYSLPAISADIDKHIDFFYRQTLGAYWNEERVFIDDHYQTIPFPFEEIKHPLFTMNFNWHVDQFTGYLKTWSAVQHYIKAKGINPVDEFYDTLTKHWSPGELKEVVFKVLLRVGKRIKSIE